MPHAELHYSDDLDIDAGGLLADIEALILRHERRGRTKAAPIRGDPSHPFQRLWHFWPPHRNAAFLAALQADLVAALSPHLPRPVLDQR